MAGAQDQPERAARLLAAAAALRATLGAALSPQEQADCERTLAAVRARLDEAASRPPRRTGRALRLEEAIAYALAAGDAADAPAVPGGADRGQRGGAEPGGSGRWRC